MIVQMKSFLINLTLLFTFASSALSQKDSTNEPVSLFIPSLKTVIDSALIHSPLLKIKELNIAVLDNETRMEKKKWLNYIFIEGATNYGLFDQVVISNTNTQEPVTSGLLSKSQQIRYYGGIGAKIPLSLIINRSNELKIKHLNIEQANLEFEEAQSQLKQLIIEEYYKLIYFQESMNTFINIYNTLNISYLKSEKDVVDGVINLNDFAMLTSTVGKAKDDCSKARNSFFAQYNKLEEIVGVNFNLECITR